MKKNRLKTVIFKQKSLLLYKYCFLCYIEPIWKAMMKRVDILYLYRECPFG